MTRPTSYPWTARLAQTKADAKKAATAAGRKQTEGAAEYDAFHERRWENRELHQRRAYENRPNPATRVEAYLARQDARKLVARFDAGASEIDFRRDVRRGRFILARFAKTLTKLSIPVRRVLRGFSGGDRYGWKPVFALLLTMDEYSDFSAYRLATEGQREKANARAARRRAEEREAIDDLAASMGVLPGSRAFKWYMEGEIDGDECRRIGDITRRRHEETNYDELLAEGMDRDTARELMTSY